jgi:hypothetical protein
VKRIWAVAFTLVLVSCGGKGGPVSDADMLRAQAALAPFKSSLVSELTAAVVESPAHAIDVCRLRAPVIAESLSTAGVRVGRASNLLRNPGNAPQPWMAPLLADYEAHPDRLDPRAVRLDDKMFGYVEPITVKPLCLVCHGEEIVPAVQERLDALYPEDRATGYRVGDVRGIFWVTMPLGDEE